MPALKSQINRHRQATRTFDKIKMRAHLNACRALNMFDNGSGKFL